MSGGAPARALRMVEALAGSEVSGARLTDLARAVGTSNVTALRDLEGLLEAGWAQKLPNGLWRLSPLPLQMLYDFQAGLAEAENRLDEARRNYSRRPV